MPVVITAFADKTFKYVTKTPPASYFIKKVGGRGGWRQDGFAGRAQVCVSLRLLLCACHAQGGLKTAVVCSAAGKQAGLQPPSKADSHSRTPVRT